MVLSLTSFVNAGWNSMTSEASYDVWHEYQVGPPILTDHDSDYTQSFPVATIGDEVNNSGCRAYGWGQAYCYSIPSLFQSSEAKAEAHTDSITLDYEALGEARTSAITDADIQLDFDVTFKLSLDDRFDRECVLKAWAEIGDYEYYAEYDYPPNTNARLVVKKWKNSSLVGTYYVTTSTVNGIYRVFTWTDSIDAEQLYANDTLVTYAKATIDEEGPWEKNDVKWYVQVIAH